MTWTHRSTTGRAKTSKYTIDINPADQRQDRQDHDGLRRRLRLGSARSLLRHVPRRRSGDPDPDSSDQAAGHAGDVPERRLQGSPRSTSRMSRRKPILFVSTTAKRTLDEVADATDKALTAMQAAIKKDKLDGQRSAHHDHDELGRRELRFRHRAAGRSQRSSADRSGQGRQQLWRQGAGDQLHRLAGAVAAVAPDAQGLCRIRMAIRSTRAARATAVSTTS